MTDRLPVRPQRRLLFRSLAAAPLLLLAGCGGLVGRDRDSDRQVFALNDVQPPTGTPVSWQLAIDEPATPAMLNRARIALQRADGQFDYFADASWSDRLPSLARLVLIQSFSNSGRILGLAEDTLTLRADYQLRSSLRAFQAHYRQQGEPPEAVVAVGVQLVRLPERVAVDARVFERRRPAQRDSLSAIAGALDAAFSEVQQELVGWALTSGSRDYASRR
ncbi:ABC-type transport auxiliary lipoprotein family protein [Aquibaculum arenosum]|uniref:ABC-type transport auxiliary lipoprotein family protein n=1 Tax=Aquibaculum arenosum TaxID=3032591 RepID=A0ABT5YHZ6_9PROT|nr:ABC-type transport auxiliary lipoprotein family protein [Fodinicurvata sp. CAU 1616]MDF2094565.1 ABC-type transport auxiliary lipoprotein family protein [Fodinicurvata sp. CAU 1616]